VSPQISWHRGGDELAPSATLKAFEAAAELAAEWIEVDVRRTADGVLVCVHDAGIPGIGRVVDIDYRSLTVAQREKVPTLDEFLGVLQRGGERAGNPVGTGVHLDLKGTGYELEAVEAITRTGRTLLVTTEDDSSVQLVRAHYSDVDAFLSLPRGQRGQGFIGAVRMFFADVWPYGRLRKSGATGIAVQYILASPGMRRWCRRNGLSVLVWTVDSPSALRRWLARQNVDIVTTNRPMAAIRLRDHSEVALAGGDRS
jgi:glycerophosphoryl diester phosphodiesterase